MTRPTSRQLLGLITAHAVTGLVAVGALIYVLTLGPRITQVERREITKVQVERIIAKGVVPGKIKTQPPGLPRGVKEVVLSPLSPHHPRTKGKG